MNICFVRRPHVASEMIQEAVQTYQCPTIQKMHTIAYKQISLARTLKYNQLFQKIMRL